MFLPRESLMLTISVRQGNRQKHQVCISSSGKPPNSRKGPLNIFNGPHKVNPFCPGALRLCVKTVYTHLRQKLWI